MSPFRQICALFLIAISYSEAFTTTTTASRPLAVTALAAINNNESSIDDSRRNMFKKTGLFAAAVAFTPVMAANALDMDAFANAQVRKKHRELGSRGKEKRCFFVNEKNTELTTTIRS
jgi:hypothetical protein